jgi:phosphopantothenate---cysteine ligase (CTP)
MPLAVVTCGPAYEPIDDVRRITNQSTGELGSILSETLSAAGLEVLCLRGQMSVHPKPKDVRVIDFSTNASLLGVLKDLPIQPAAIFHAAALCDFLVHKIEGTGRARKIRSATAELRLVLRPAEKILPRLRPLFPDAVIVAWKYELDGSREDAIARARLQIVTSKADACVVNGTSYGAGFGFLEHNSEEPRHLAGKAELCEFLAGWTLDNLKPLSASARGDQLPPSLTERSVQRKSRP